VPDGLGFFFCEPGDEHVVPGLDHVARDAGDLLDALAFAQDHFRHPQAKLAMVVDPRKPEIFVRQAAKPFDGRSHVEVAALNGL
jgi:hypothetical protein